MSAGPPYPYLDSGAMASLSAIRRPFIMAAGLDSHMQVGKSTTMGSVWTSLNLSMAIPRIKSGSDNRSLMTIEESIAVLIS